MRREIVLTRAMVVAAVGYAALLGVHFGLFDLTPAVQAQVVDVLNWTLPLAIPALGALWARLHVTPVYDPQTSRAVPLIPAPTVHLSDEAPAGGIPANAPVTPVTAAAAAQALANLDAQES